MIAERQSPLSAIEYLEWEKCQQVRHEYISGEIFAMTGGSKAHSAIAVNLTAEVRTHLRSGPCQVFNADTKVQISADGPFFYPDLSVTCDERDNQPGYTAQYPCLIVEVLSPSTEAFDRGEKFRHYRRLASLQEYVLVDSHQPGVECYRRSSENNQLWVLQTYDNQSIVRLDSVDLDMPIAALYEKVQFGS
ncbi:MAG: Uma2 family endonuclease [Gemmatimonadaceae bacterium]|nr:Uma2 family endonuclease [Gloeobacterales cyanobacterium ES-bin-141]